MAYNPDKYNPESRRRYYLKNKEKSKLYSTVYNRERKYGVSDKQYQQMLLDQDGLCAICSKVCTRQLALDHDHSTGKVRGLLCNNCNRGLGHFKDNPTLLVRAVKYLGFNIIETV